MNILIGLTTTKFNQIEPFLEEIRKLYITQIALFPTALDKRQRAELYRQLEDSPIKVIPHVHLRTDMDDAEIEYFIEHFQTQVFNIHSCYSTHPYLPQSQRYVKKIFIENSGVIPTREELEQFGGLCIDFSHWENGRRMGEENYRDFELLAHEFPIGCCHISAIRSSPSSPWHSYDDHVFSDLKEFDYLQNYKAYLPEWLSLELENLPHQQLQVKAYLERMLCLVSNVT